MILYSKEPPKSLIFFPFIICSERGPDVRYQMIHPYKLSFCPHQLHYTAGAKQGNLPLPYWSQAVSKHTPLWHDDEEEPPCPGELRSLLLLGSQRTRNSLKKLVILEQGLCLFPPITVLCWQLFSALNWDIRPTLALIMSLSFEELKGFAEPTRWPLDLVHFEEKVNFLWFYNSFYIS